MITLSGVITRTGAGRITFGNWEAKEFLKTGITSRKLEPDEQLFQLGYQGAVDILYLSLDKAELNGKDNHTRRNKIYTHSFRKYFKTKLTKVVNEPTVRILMGHRGYLDKSYIRKTEEDLIAEYEQGMHVLSIFMDGEDV